MKAIIRIGVPEYQIGQEVSCYFKDTMNVKGICEAERTGHWIEENHDEYEIWICSECGAHTELDMSEEYGCGWKFCPMCGADMRGDNNDKR